MLQDFKKVIQAEIEKKTKFIHTQDTINTRKIEYNLLYQTISKMKENEVEIPEKVIYRTYDEWLKNINKKLKSRENASLLVKRYKKIVLILTYYLEKIEAIEAQ